MSVVAGFEATDAQAKFSVSCSTLMPDNLNAELSSTSPALCLPACCCVLYDDDKRLNL